MDRTDAVGAVVVRADGRVVVVRRGRAPARGQWSLPGGKIEAGETYAEAIVREVREETALHVRVVALLAVVALDHDRDGERFSYAIHEHLCVPAAGGADALDLRAGDDADDARWVTPSEAAGLGVSADVLRMIALAFERDDAHA